MSCEDKQRHPIPLLLRLELFLVLCLYTQQSCFRRVGIITVTEKRLVVVVVVKGGEEKEC